MRSDVRFVASLMVAAALVLAACGKKNEKTAGENPARVASAAASAPQSPLVGSERAPDLKALHDSVHARGSRGDTLGLLRLFARDSLYRAVVWPTQPSYEPGREEVWNLVSGMNKANSNKGLRRLLGYLQGSKPALPPLPDGFQATPVPGGTIHGSTKSTRKSGEIWMFAAALCLEDGCQVLTYAEAGLQGGETPSEEEVSQDR